MTRPFLFFDLDNTILDFSWAERRALSLALREVGLEPAPEVLERYRVINIGQWELLEEGKLSREQVLVTRYELLFREFGIVASAKAVGDRYEQLLAQGHRFLPGAKELLETLQPRAHLYIVSNGCAAVQASRIASADLARYFEGIFISEELGADKPSPIFFRRCFERIPDFDPRFALVLGDSLSSDIRGGKNAGLLTCWYNPGGEKPRHDVVPDYEIRELSALPALLDRIFAELPGH